MDATMNEEPRDSVGTVLRARRVAMKAELRAVSDALRIRESYLRAIEQGRYDELPGPAYAAGFVRAYAEYVGLDGTLAINRFKEETAGLKGDADLHFPAPVTDAGIPGGAIVMVGLLIAALGYGAWYLSTSQDVSVDDVVPPLPDRLATLLPESPPSGVPDTPGQSPLSATADVADPSGVSAAAGTETTDGDGVALSAPSAAEPDSAAGVDTGIEREAVIEGGLDQADPSTVPADVRDVGTEVSDAGEAMPSAASVDARSVEMDITSESAEVPAVQAATDAAPPQAPDLAPVSEDGPGMASEGPAVPVVPAAVPAPGTDPIAAVSPPDDAAPNAAAVDATTPDTSAAGSDGTADEAGTAIADRDIARMDIAGPVARPDETPSVILDADQGAAGTDDSPGDRLGDRPDVTETPPSEAADAAPAVTRTVAAPPLPPPVNGDVASGRVFGAPNGSRILVRATRDSWIQVRDEVAGGLVLTRLLRAGDSYRVPDRPGLKLLTGNAGALQITVDGQAVPPIGEPGDVRRAVALDAGRLLGGTAVLD